MKTRLSSPRVIVITGASGGLGRALAEAYAAPGVTLGLLGRDEARLKEAASACERKGASALAGVVDVCDRAGMNSWLAAFDAPHPIDLLIANAGISAGAGEAGESEEQMRRVIDVNLGGVLNSVLPIIPLMQQRKCGQIALISSLAGVRGLAACPSYSTSKTAVRALGEGLRGLLDADNIGVSVVCPGYIRTNMTAKNRFPMPFLMDADKAAGIIRRGLAKNRSRIAFPLAMFLPLWLLSCLPPALTDTFFAALPRKQAME